MKYSIFLRLALFFTVLATARPALAGGADGIPPAPADLVNPSAAQRDGRHPLDPLTEQEIAQAARLLRADPRVPKGAFFPTLVLHEPAKAEVLNLTAQTPVRREAYVEVFDRPNNTLYAALVDLTENLLRTIKVLPSGTQPAAFPDEFKTVPRIVRADRQWVKAMRRRGINPDDVYLDVWTGGDLPIAADRDGKPVAAETRIMRVLSFFRGNLPNPYARPIEGVVVAVDMNRLRVLQVVDTGIRPLSQDSGVADPQPSRAPLKPLQVVQPDGPSYVLNGHEVSWQNWRFRFALHPREGLVLYTVGYLQDGRVRPIAYRISLSEVFIPYGLADSNWAWRAAFDGGDYGLGLYANSLAVNVDVPENATFFDARLADDNGGSYAIPQAIALYERDGGVLWKRVDPTSAQQDARFGRELVITANYWIGNYIYGTNYIFRQDGSLEVKVDATGTTLNRGVHTVAQGEEFGTAVTAQVAAPNHQHFFNFRLDLDIDETANTVVESNVKGVPSDFGNAFTGTETTLNNEAEAQRDLNPTTARTWKVKSTTVKNVLGHPTGYTLRPGEGNGVPYAARDFAPRQRAGYIEHALWVTAYQPDELYAAGAYPNQGQAGAGLPCYADGESILNRDVVMWYSVPLTHLPEVEEYPVMPTASVGFKLTPDGFFSRNPALDVPPSK